MRWSLLIFILYSAATALGAPVKGSRAGNTASTNHPTPRAPRPSRSSSSSSGSGPAASASHTPAHHTGASVSRSHSSPGAGPSSGHVRASPSSAMAAKLETWTRGKHPKVKSALLSSTEYSKNAEHSPWILKRPHAYIDSEHWVRHAQTAGGTRNPNPPHRPQPKLTKAQKKARKQANKGKGLPGRPYHADHVFEHQMLHAGLEIAGHGKGKSFKTMPKHHQDAIRKILNDKSNMQFLEADINNRKGLRVRKAMEHTMPESERHARGVHKWEHVEGSTGYMKETAGIAAHTAKRLDDYLTTHSLVKEPVMHALLETTYRRAGIIRHDEGIVPLPPPTHPSTPSTPTPPHTPPPHTPPLPDHDAAGNPVHQGSPSTGMTRPAPGTPNTPPQLKRMRSYQSPS